MRLFQFKQYIDPETFLPQLVMLCDGQPTTMSFPVEAAQDSLASGDADAFINSFIDQLYERIPNLLETEIDLIVGTLTHRKW